MKLQKLNEFLDTILEDTPKAITRKKTIKYRDIASKAVNEIINELNTYAPSEIVDQSEDSEEIEYTIKWGTHSEETHYDYVRNPDKDDDDRIGYDEVENGKDYYLSKESEKILNQIINRIAHKYRLDIEWKDVKKEPEFILTIEHDNIDSYSDTEDYVTNILENIAKELNLTDYNIETREKESVLSYKYTGELDEMPVIANGHDYGTCEVLPPDVRNEIGHIVYKHADRRNLGQIDISNFQDTVYITIRRG